MTNTQAMLPRNVLADLQQIATGADPKALPRTASEWIADEIGVRVQHAIAEWSEEEIYISLPRAGGGAWMSIDLATGELVHERTDRGWISYLNDLHKGRNTGPAWSVFIDVFAFATLVFAITGLLLLKMHAQHRPATWPAVGFGLVLPVLLAILFIH